MEARSLRSSSFVSLNGRPAVGDGAWVFPHLGEGGWETPAEDVISGEVT